ncbi:MAG: GSCFA domain-containing protein [Bacteroidales bacterium]|jgi:hypothetical protein|nr:GSCFA domain-containing protein [Bacteroidales bacterium]
MKFRTPIPLPEYPFRIAPTDTLMLLGSCFTQHIGDFFENSRFKVQVNPFGTLFNPCSIALALNLLLQKEHFDEKYIYKHEPYYVSFAHNTTFSRTDVTELKQLIDNQIENSSDFLHQAQYLFLTLGTAYCYRFKERNLIVSNCHKIPNHQFEKIRLSVEEIVALFEPILAIFRQEMPSLKVIFTVSPVRHLSDGFHENTLSKAMLHLSIEQLVQRFENTYYFPSYEIFQDDLRDYRFYDTDLCHPSPIAIQYVKECVAQTFLTAETQQWAEQNSKETLRRKHRKIMNNEQ